VIEQIGPGAWQLMVKHQDDDVILDKTAEKPQISRIQGL
jgi:hypothetical protein